MAFSGFGPQAVPFFKALAFHQTKDWFEFNRAIYEGEIKGPLGDLVEELTARFAKAKTSLKGDRKASLFRINRDVRFAKDKSPYKTNAGAVLSRTGAKNDPGMLYVHVSAEGCFAAAGFWQPEPDGAGAAAGGDRARAEGVEDDGRQARRRRPGARGRIRAEAHAARFRGDRGSADHRRGPQHVVHLLARHPRRPAR